MKKFSSILIIILVTGLFANAQSKATKKADKLFSKFEFVDAAKAYEALIAKGEANAYVYGKLADAYYNVFNTVEAEKWYAKTLKSSAFAKVPCWEWAFTSANQPRSLIVRRVK